MTYPGAMRASDDDRARVQTMLNDAFAEGRLTKYEWESRAGDLANAATWADLDRLTADLPGAYPAVPSPPPMQAAQRTNPMAIAALACGLGQFLVGFPASIAAIVLGHKARRQIRQTGEPGDGMAKAALILGYIGIALIVVLVLILLVIGIALSRTA